MSNLKIGDLGVLVDSVEWNMYRQYIGALVEIISIGDRCPHGHRSTAVPPHELAVDVGVIGPRGCRCFFIYNHNFRPLPDDREWQRQETVRWDDCPWAPGRVREIMIDARMTKEDLHRLMVDEWKNHPSNYELIDKGRIVFDDATWYKFRWPRT